MMEIPGAVLILLIIAMLTTGIALGTLIERSRWNALIRRGIIPKPSNSAKS